MLMDSPIKTSLLEVPTPFSMIDQLLRDRAAFLERIEQAEQSSTLARALVLTIVFGGVAFGAVLGGYRGGAQIAFAAIKFPLLLLLTAGLTAPALTALTRVATGSASMRSDLLLILGSLALSSLLLFALAPVLLLAITHGIDYHRMIMLTVAAAALAGAAGLQLFLRGVRRRAGHGHGLAAATMLGLFMLVGSQMSWVLRPYLVRPRTPEVPFVRVIEGSFLDSVERSFDSARGIYSELPCELER
jgi:hypothetical protein